MTRIMIAVHHPAHVHFFKHVIRELEDGGHDVYVVVRDKEITIELLEQCAIPHDVVVRSYEGMWDLIRTQTAYEWKLLRKGLKIRPEITLSIGSPAVGHVSKIVGATHVLFTDTDVPSNRLAIPFADVVCTPVNFERDYGSTHVRYPGYHELAYLHPDLFDPNPDVLREHGVEPEDEFFVMRFVGWGAHHDVGKKGLSRECKRRLVSRFAREGDVYITSEGNFPEEFAEYQIPVPSHHIHNLLYYANLYVGDSGTMATEAALLGTPAIRSSPFPEGEDISNFAELEQKYDLLYSVVNDREVLDTVDRLLDEEYANEMWEEKRSVLLADKINVADFVLGIVNVVNGG